MSDPTTECPECECNPTQMATPPTAAIEKALPPRAPEEDLARTPSVDAGHKPDGKCKHEREELDLFGVHPLRRAAYQAFERELPRLREELFAQGCSEKEWVVFHGEKYLGHARREFDLLQKWCTEGGVPEEEIYCHPLMPVLKHIHVLRADII